MLRKALRKILYVPVRILYEVQKRRALRGHYGEERQWATELVVREEDREFILAIQALPDNELLEIGIISEDKAELRKRTVDRFDQMDRDAVPEDFMQ
jgi:hypothetical protein